jgi:hypothetical protein
MKIATKSLLALVFFFAAIGQQANAQDSLAVEIEFKVNMGVSLLNGSFNPNTDVVTIAGSPMNGWNNTADTLRADFLDPNVYSKVVKVAKFPAGGTAEYKFVHKKSDGAGGFTDNWEGVDNRKFTLTGSETDTDVNGFLDVSLPVAFFNNVTFDDIFTSTTTVVVEVDARPAYYFLADSLYLPGDTQTGDPVTSLTSIFANGPFATGAGWQDWGPANLGQVSSLQLVDDGTKGDVAAGDSIFTFTLIKNAGEPKKGAMKFGVDGYDNESGFGGDHNINVDPANPVVRLAYGATLKADGKYNDDNGPTRANQYDPYVMINNATTPPSFSVVRRGGTDLEPVKIEVEVKVNMAVKILNGSFNPGTDFVTAAGGTFNGWNNKADTLRSDFLNPHVYTKVFKIDTFAAPGTIEFKFVTLTADGNGGTIDGWEGVSNRMVSVTGTEADADQNGYLDVVLEEMFFDNVTLNDIFSSDTSVRVEVDARSAYYFLADSLYLPGDTQTGDPVTAFNGLFANGPFATNGGWEDWGPANLGQIESLRLVDDGTKGDVTPGDSIYTFTLNKLAGMPKKGAMKFGVDGYDNESGFGGDHSMSIDQANPVVRLVYGATLQANGTYTDAKGPRREDQYDAYILIDNTTTPPSVMAVRRGGENDLISGTATEDVQLPETVVLYQNFPNPFNPTTTFTYDLRRSGNVRLQIFDLLGREVAVLVNGFMPASRHQVQFDASNLASGTYLYRLQAADQVIVKTMVLLK